MNTPELIIHNGAVSTLDAAHPMASAVAIAGGRITAVGGDELLKTADKTTRRIDLKGRRVVPGLNDSHLHVIRGGLNFNMELRWDGVPSLADALLMLRGAGPAHAAAAMGPGDRRLDGVPVCGTSHADPGRDQSGRARHPGFCPSSLRPRYRQRGRATRHGLYAGDA